MSPAPTVRPTDADVIGALKRAALLLAAVGWRQGSPTYESDADPLTMSEAMGFAAGRLPGRHRRGAARRRVLDLESAMCDALRPVLGTGDRWPGIIPWNDEPGRTVEQVVAVLEAAAERLETPSTLSPVEQVRLAIREPGPRPHMHAATMGRHRREWPTLWAALDRLLTDDGTPNA